MSAPRITACICTYNRYDLLPKAIESVLEQSLPRSAYRILVVDNSPDHTAAEAFGTHYSHPGFLTYRIEKTPGLSNARNVGTRECGTEFIAFMDDDAMASNQWLEKLLAAFDRFGKEAVVAGGRVEPMWESARPAWLHDWLLGFVSVVDWGGTTRIAAPNEWLAGTNIAFRAASLIEAGGFDTKLGRIGGGATLLSNEEITMLRDFRKRGLNALYVPEASVRHLVERKRLSRSWLRKRVAWQAVSDFMMDPAASSERVPKEWDKVLEYFFQLPPSQRNILGLYVDTDDPTFFQRQLHAIELCSLAMLTGFQDAGVSAYAK